MQILKLEFEGIGPFTGRQAIDFRALCEGGLFLLEGPTGSGKTTVLDALVFALYGDVAGADSSRARLVSTQLPPGVEPFVDLTLETGRGLLRVRRVPQHERRKARGLGTTVGKASITLWKLADPDGEGVLLSTSMQEAGEELQGAIGLTKEQFTQTVVLPQGQFATFLRARPEDRRGVLQDIFGTEFYARCARQLAELAARHREREASARSAVERAASGLASVAWADGDDGARGRFGESALDDPVAGAVAARERLAELGGAARRAREAACQATDVSRVADAALRSLGERNALIVEHEGLLGRATELEDAAPANAEHEARLAGAERAEHVRHPLLAASKARVALEKARADVARGLGQLVDGPDADLPALASPESLDAEGIATRETRSALGSLVELEGGLQSRAESLRLDVAALGERRASLSAQRKRVDADLSAAAEAGVELESLAELAEARADRRATRSEAEARLAAVGRLEDLAGALATARASEGVAGEAAAKASVRHRAARAAWLGGLAGTLAGELVVGAPCPVCGSTDHPAPAVRPQGLATRAEVERLEAAARGADQAWVKAQASCDALAVALTDQRLAVGGLTRAEAEAALAEATEGQARADRAATRVSELRRRIQSLRERAEKGERALRLAEQTQASEEGGLAARSERLDADRLRVLEALDGHPSVADRASALGRRAERASRLAGLLRSEAAGRLELEGRVADLDGVLAERGFASLPAAEAALLDTAERARLASAIRDHRSQAAAIAERLADPRFATVSDGEPTDEGPVRHAAESARHELEVALHAKGATTSTLELASRAADELAEGVEHLGRARAEAEPYLRLADLAAGAGDNLANVTLPTFVLLRRFEEVLDLANERLDLMTGGRYSLRRIDAREGRSQKLGLGLEVVDHLSGDAARDPKTLSGGETFQASLAMALGLADAVTAEAGGVELNTLFVDEGFGSLDPEALDMVMSQLSALRDGGRCVGVVSHVADMKQRIAERITVIPRRDGTSTLSCSTDPQPALAG